MAKGTENLEFIPGYITLTDAHGRKTRHPVADVLRSTDIPTGLTYSQVGAISTLASLFVVLIRTLQAKGIIDESFMDEGQYDLKAVVEVLENMGADYTLPDITTTPAP